MILQDVLKLIKKPSFFLGKEKLKNDFKYKMGF